MSELESRHCIPCQPGTPALSGEEVGNLIDQVPGWILEDGKLTRDVRVKDFASALALVNRVGGVAEEENHHPDILIHGWNHVRLELSTHSVGGLSENDFILAARLSGLIDEATRQSR